MDSEIKTLLKTIFFGGLLVYGLFTGVSNVLRRPPDREALTPVTIAGPPHVDYELIYESSGKQRSSYRRQRFFMTLPGGGFVTASPPKNLWVDSIDTMPLNATSTFLVDPDTSVIYEATGNGQTMLAFETARQRQNQLATRGLLYGFGLAAAGCIGLFVLYRPRPVPVRSRD